MWKVIYFLTCSVILDEIEEGFKNYQNSNRILIMSIKIKPEEATADAFSKWYQPGFSHDIKNFESFTSTLALQLHGINLNMLLELMNMP